MRAGSMVPYLGDLNYTGGGKGTGGKSPGPGGTHKRVGWDLIFVKSNE